MATSLKSTSPVFSKGFKPAGTWQSMPCAAPVMSGFVPRRSKADGTGPLFLWPGGDQAMQSRKYR